MLLELNAMLIVMDARIKMQDTRYWKQDKGCKMFWDEKVKYFVNGK